MNFILVSFVVLSLTACTLTVSPDGSRTYAPDPATLRVILEK